MSPAGQDSSWSVERLKEVTMTTKLTDKNMQMLSNSDVVDADLGVATPSCVALGNSSSVKEEFPSLQKLTEGLKAAKKTYLTVFPVMCVIFSFIQLMIE